MRPPRWLQTPPPPLPLDVSWNLHLCDPSDSHIHTVPSWVTEQTVEAVVTSRLDEQRARQEKVAALDERLKHMRDTSTEASKVQTIHCITVMTCVMLCLAISSRRISGLWRDGR